MSEIIPVERIETKIFSIRGRKVMLDFDLAKLYEVPTGRLNEQVKRNINRFPEDFMFSLSRQEIMRISQFAISSNIKFAKSVNAFSENGVAMLSSVLNSDRAISVNIQIMRTFTHMRQILSTNKDLTYLVKELKHKVDQHDTEIGLIVRAIEKMIATEKKPKGKMGFIAN